ncbi:MAG: methyltransferase domain-containing protein [Cyanobacteria bacterium]|jgi:SAM-dependent methyltransferase|nr:methyltransferase domain-containing protein [Cyanobacteria bacterium GSL.Bin21]
MENLKCILCSYTVPLDAVIAKKIRCNVRQFQEQEFTLWRCPNCQSLHSKEIVDLADYYANYPLKKQPLDYFRKRICQNRLNLLIQQGFQKQHSLLDYGCNQGLFIDFLWQKGYINAIGYDPYVEEYSDPSLLKKQYDYITCQDVIEHTEDPNQCFSQLVKGLNKRGTLILGTPTAEAINLEKSNAFLLQLHQPYHRHILSEKVLLNLGQRLQLKPVYISRRWINDSLYPFVNTRLSWGYARALDNNIDVFCEPIQLQTLLTSPQLWFYAFLGYFFPLLGNVIIVFKVDHTLKQKET